MAKHDGRISAEQAWFIVGRWQEYDGELRANLLRIIAIGAFYIVELCNYYGARWGWDFVSVADPFHRTVTILAAAWVMLALAVQCALRARILPPFLKYLTTAADLVFLTCLLILADGPRSPLVVGYFVVIVIAGLRLQLRLVWCATLGAIAGYLMILGYAKWYAGDRDLLVPRHQQLIVALGLLLTGVALGQLIRRVKLMAHDFAQRQQSGSAPATAGGDHE